MTNTVKKRDYILFAFCAVICYLVFQQGDIGHTGGCSFSYLQGHILDFYEWTAQEGDMYASYMPSTYILFAIWNIPLKLFGIVEKPMVDAPYGVLMYYKLLPTLFYLGSAILIYRIAREAGMRDGKAKLCMYAFLTTPIGFYSQFLFGQYDSFTVFFVLLGIYYYLKDNRALFVLFFALSLPFKYFSLLVFVPMLLLREKNIWKIIRDIVLVTIPYLLELVIYYPSEIFRDYVLGFVPTDYVYSASVQTGSTSLSLVVCTFCLICAWAYFKHVSGKLLLAQWVCFFASLSCAVIFGLSQWHPQWLLFAVPFWVLGAFLHKNTKAFWVLDVLMMLFFCMFLSNAYYNNADQAMMGLGLFGRDMFGKEVMPYLNTELQMRDIYYVKNVSLIGTIFTALMLVSAIFKYPPLAQANLVQEIPHAMRALWARFLIGMAMFVIPAAACYLVACTSPYLCYHAEEEAPIGPLVGKTLSQVFVAPVQDICRIDFYQGNYNRVNTVPLVVTIYEVESGIQVHETVLDTGQFRDNHWISFELEEGTLQQGMQYRIDFEAPGADLQNCISLYKSSEMLSETTYSMEAGVPKEYNLGFRLYRKSRGN